MLGEHVSTLNGLGLCCAAAGILLYSTSIAPRPAPFPPRQYQRAGSALAQGAEVRPYLEVPQHPRCIAASSPAPRTTETESLDGSFMIK